MIKTIIALAGIAFLLLGFNLNTTIREGERLAKKLDDKKKSYAVIGEDSPPACSSYVPRTVRRRARKF